MLTSFASHLTTVTKCNSCIKLSWSPWKYSTHKKLKYSSVQTQGGQVVTVYQIGEQFGSAYKRAATGEIAAKGFRATGLFPCDKNVFRPHDFPLASEDTEAAPVNHPALVKTSDQSSFISVNFSPWIFAEVPRASDISAVPSLNLQRSVIIQFCYFFAVDFCRGSPCIRYQRCTKPEPAAKSSRWKIKKSSSYRNFQSFFSQINAQLDNLKINFKFALKSTLKSSYMFRCETPSLGSTLSEPC